MSKKTVLITGCSQGGIGEALVRAFHDKEYHVFATLPNVTKAGSLAELDDVELLTLEVTSTESINQVAEIVAKHTGGTLDILVNNVGVDFVMPLLDVNIDEAKKLFDVNVWSILATTQAFAPMIIKTKGVICNISSSASCMPFAYAGIYSSSKIASRQISETLRIELAPLGVRVLTGIIGAVHTPIHQNAGELHLKEDSYYTCVVETISKQRQGEMKPGSQQPVLVARNIVNDILGGRVGLIWRGGYASTMRLLGGLSSAILEYVANRDKNLDVVKKVNAQKN